MQTIHLHPKFYRVSKTVARLSDEAQQRWHRLNLYQQLRTEGCSEATALQAIGWSRSSCYRWRRRLQQQGPRGLEARSRRPRRVRRRQWNSQHFERVREIRLAHPLWGRAKIRTILAREYGIELSESTVGRMLSEWIRRRQVLPAAFYQGRTGNRKPRIFNRHARRWRRTDRARTPGQMIQIDHMSVTVEAGFSVKEFKATCPTTRLCVMRTYSRATALCATRFLQYLKQQLPFEIQSIQVDGGSEFMAEFEAACQQLNIPLYVLPPKSPQLNGCVERANGTSRYEFYPFYCGNLNVRSLNLELERYQHQYNHYRPHQALGQLTPMENYNQLLNQSALAA